MATARPCLAQLSRLCIRPTLPISSSTRFLSTTALRAAAPKAAKNVSSNPQKNKKKGTEVKKKKARTAYKQYDMTDAEMFALCDAMRCVSLKPT